MKKITISTNKKKEVVDITELVKKIVEESGAEKGICMIYTPGATSAIIINENWDPNICLDFLDTLDKVAPQGSFRHDKVDNNGAAHVKAAIVGPSETVPIRNGELSLGQWQDIMFCDFDGPREKREIMIEILES